MPVGISSSSATRLSSVSSSRLTSESCSNTTLPGRSCASSFRPRPSTTMPMSSLKERIEWLERELPPNPPRFKIHEDLPFAILRYDPTEEWDVRREVRLLATRLEAKGRPVTVISLAELLWKAIDENEGIEAVGALERERGFEAAQEQVNTYLSDDDFTPLPRLVAERLNALDP